MEAGEDTGDEDGGGRGGDILSILFLLKIHAAVVLRSAVIAAVDSATP